MDLDRCVALALGGLPADAGAMFTQDPLGALRNELRLKVEPVQHLAMSRDDGGACDGTSFLEDGVILYAPTPYSRRENFTLAHELGHWLVDRSDEAIDWIADHRNASSVLESVCDRVAQQVLLPDEVVGSQLGADVARAHHVERLYAASVASYPVCAIGLKARLRGLGAVIIVDPASGVVEYSSINPDPDDGWPTVFPWPGQSVPSGHPLASMTAGSTVTRKSFWRNPWGAQQDYYVDAVCDGRRVVAVLSALDLWDSERLHLDAPRAFDERPTAEISCCGERLSVKGYPCAECGRHYCPRCGLCRCQRAELKEVLCNGTCFMKFQPHLLVDGRCEECRS
jgi:hypothetical protein